MSLSVASAFWKPCSTPLAGFSGVVSTFSSLNVCVLSWRTITSVNVPPTSTAMRIVSNLSEARGRACYYLTPAFVGRFLWFYFLIQFIDTLLAKQLLAQFGIVLLTFSHLHNETGSVCHSQLCHQRLPAELEEIAFM